MFAYYSAMWLLISHCHISLAVLALSVSTWWFTWWPAQGASSWQLCLETPLSLSLSGPYQRHFSLGLEVMPPFFSAQPLAEQLFIKQSEVVENNFFTVLRQKILKNCSVQSATRSLGIKISIWIHGAQNHLATVYIQALTLSHGFDSVLESKKFF